MTPMGHSLFGATLALVMLRGSCARWRQFGTVCIFVILANLPDLRVRGWGHDRYDISHSVIVNGGLIALALLMLLPWTRLRNAIGDWRIFLGGTAAWLSHLLLDSFYNHGLGVAIFWPVSTARLTLPLPWFETVKRSLPYVDGHTLRVIGIELLAYGSLLLVVLVVRGIRLRGHQTSRDRSATAASAS